MKLSWGENMAEQLKLVIRDESVDFYGGSGDLSSLDLLTWVAENGWTQMIATDDTIDVDEALTLHIPGSSDDNLASNTQALDAILVRAQRAEEFRNFQEAWLRVQLNGETGARQSMIRSIQRGKVSVLDFLAAEHYFTDYVLGLRRTPLWEGTVLRSFTGTGLSALGGKLNYTGIVGDRPARPAMTKISGSDALDEFWVGVQSTRLNTTPEDFNPVWNLTLTAVANRGADFNILADATAITGQKVAITFFSEESLVMRAIITVNEVTNAQYGRYQVLLRAKVTGTQIARVRLGFGNWFNSQGFFNILPNRVRVDSTDWKLYSLGEVDLPIRPHSVSVIGFRSAGLRIEAESIPGWEAGYLEMDSLILIPRLDGFMHLKAVNPVNTNWVHEAYYRPGGEIYGKVLDALGLGVQIEELHPDQRRWGLEPGKGTLVCAAQNAGISTLGDTFDLQVKAYETWLTLRGAE